VIIGSELSTRKSIELMWIGKETMLGVDENAGIGNTTAPAHGDKGAIKCRLI
jgi:hypothetical protein